MTGLLRVKGCGVFIISGSTFWSSRAEAANVNEEGNTFNICETSRKQSFVVNRKVKINRNTNKLRS